ncbi:MAG TPA: adenylate/guanylate cyclase domain-containing protein [Solirubrobacteraceae bacterium]|nr:adenylate/guanylate cyclase domain-containing protein [Solirubrobacteraceae bacterium]
MTALFCDVTGSTALGEELDPELLREVMNRYFADIRATIERHGGTVEKFIGDAVMAVFGIPRVREDDALRAVRAAAEIRERLALVAQDVGVRLRFRTGVNTGPVLMGEGENLAIGDAVNVAARLEQAAQPGEIVLGGDTLRLVRDAVDVEPLAPLAVKGKSQPLAAFRLLAVDPVAPGVTRHLEGPLVGRERELRLLTAAWERAVDEAGCHLFTLLGVAGVGKSRLVAELLAGARATATVLQGRCLHYGEGITFWPLLDALRSAGDEAESVIEQLGGRGAATPEELFFDVRRLLERLAAARPVILHVDDLQWAEPMLLDLLDHIAELSRGAPILLLCCARPELLEDRPSWGGGKLNATTALLEPLPAADCERLLEHLGGDLAPAARAGVITASEGNPLFLEEMAALMRERGTPAIPPTIQALLAARLERLPAEQRELLECGAVEGEVFHRLPVRALAGHRTAAEIDEAIAGLVRKELIRPHAPTLGDGEAFRFRHLLIRDAAYDSLPKRTRAQLHEQFASWLEDNASELLELDEICGWHLEQSARYQRDLGRDPGPELSRRAAEHLYAAGRRAGERGDDTAATNLLDRALALAPLDRGLKAAASAELAGRLIDIGDLTRVDALLCTAESDPDVADLAALTRFEWMLHTEPEGAIQAIQARLPSIIDRLTRSGDTTRLAKAHLAAASVHWIAAQATLAGAELRLVADYARQAGDGGLRARALAQYVLTLIYGREPVSVVAREITLMEDEDLGPYLSAFVDLGRGELRRLQSDFEGARRLTRRGIEGLAALGMGAAQGGLEQDLGQIELSAGDPAAAIVALARSDAILAELGERALRSTTQGLLALAQARCGDRGAAREAIALCEELGAAEDVINHALVAQTRAVLALGDGDLAGAERWARQAIGHWSRTDTIRSTAGARLDLARILCERGRPHEAAAELKAAGELFRIKGDAPGVAAAEALLDQLGAAR